MLLKKNFFNKNVNKKKLFTIFDCCYEVAREILHVVVVVVVVTRVLLRCSNCFSTFLCSC